MKTYESNRRTAWWSNDSVYYDSCRTLCGDGVFAKPLAVLMQAPQEALMLTSVYVRICGGGIFFIVAYNVLSAIFRGLGDSRSPLIFVMVACVVNVVGDLVLVAGFHLDAAGAAIATVLAQAVSVVLALLMLKRRQLPFKITKKISELIVNVKDS